MAETLILCDQGASNTIGSSLSVATMLKGEGVDVAVLFAMEALIAFAERRFGLPPLMATYAETMIENAKKMGMPIDTMEMLNMAKGAGVPVYACGGWTDMLGVRDKLPPEMEVVEMADTVKLMAEAKKVITFAA